MTLPVGLTLLQNSEGNGAGWGILMAGAVAGDRPHPAWSSPRCSATSWPASPRAASPAESARALAPPTSRPSIYRHQNQSSFRHHRKEPPWHINLDRRHFLGLAGARRRSSCTRRLRRPVDRRDYRRHRRRRHRLQRRQAGRVHRLLDQPPGQVAGGGDRRSSTKFHAKYPDIKVNLVTAGANYEEIAQKFQTAQAAKSGLPGLVVLSDVWWFRYFT